ncbi:hypothetical protein VSR17_17400 [Cupriavidus taiwanensis]|uniref:hypothetical protein n=1 Tax=Cupriavidus taiwanensis TaxID=164546 RepID=UPI000E107AD2|nr:hypothetical protein [Cupriavidus taiwanensis]SOY48424.1 hypothetical protein CBM2588_A150005 [Cupriavidus taiwanensis]SOY77207.1 hypothetical protein CBM2592_U40002 [Cupriavidus taiwanensis]SOZ01012.1 hypothetical protein CBM2591_U30002 [Cupriavidus taiwanensis]SOZ23056.1 hypothetical protein CBM2608_A210080 [Cupriavidus taiwanensis]SOZ56185.1 hypothetical protein CBM2617_A200006 [Cupriavidus taiwanensis]
MSNTPLPPLGDEQLRKLHKLVQSLKKLGYSKTEVVEYMRRHFPPDPAPDAPETKGPTDRTFPSRQQINETPKGGELPE